MSKPMLLPQPEVSKSIGRKDDVGSNGLLMVFASRTVSKGLSTSAKEIILCTYFGGSIVSDGLAIASFGESFMLLLVKLEKVGAPVLSLSVLFVC